MSEQKLSEEERLQQLAAQMQAAEYRGLSEEEIQEKKRQKEMKKQKNLRELTDTLSILEQGSYHNNGSEIFLCLTKAQMREVRVFLPEDIAALREAVTQQPAESGHCCFGCENIDALALAEKKVRECDAPDLLVLNMASGTHPGGKTREGASAQEEDLCRRSSLLLSLESEDAKKYYDYNNARTTRMGSDALMISPHVEVIKESGGETLPAPFEVAVLSCAAPMVRLGLEGMSQQEYEAMLCRRMQGMLLAAASQGYRRLILGAFGCGVYGNDAATVSDLFVRAIREFSYAGADCNRWFDSIDFAVLCRPDKDYNYQQFRRNFSS